MRANKKMLNELSRCQRNIHLSTELAHLLSSGIKVVDGCYVLAGLHSDQSTVTTSHFSDKTGYEAFVNSIHIYDFADTGDFATAVSFLIALLEVWTEMKRSENYKN